MNTVTDQRLYQAFKRQLFIFYRIFICLLYSVKWFVESIFDSRLSSVFFHAYHGSLTDVYFSSLFFIFQIFSSPIKLGKVTKETVGPNNDALSDISDD